MVGLHSELLHCKYTNVVAWSYGTDGRMRLLLSRDLKILTVAPGGEVYAYLNDLLFPYTPSRMLRSQGTGLLVIPRIAKSTIGGRAFSYRAPHLWNKLPAHVQSADTITLFKARLKTYLFSLSYS